MKVTKAYVQELVQNLDPVIAYLKTQYEVSHAVAVAKAAAALEALGNSLKQRP